MADAGLTGTEKCGQIKIWKRRRYLRRKRILAMLVVIMAATHAVPEGVKEVVVMDLSGVLTERRLRVGRDTAG
jgi:hypothetical protein